MTAAMLGPMLPLDAKTRKGDRFYAEGKIHEVKLEWDAALDSYQKALQEDPAEMVYQMACDRARFQASQTHVDLGRKIRAEGHLNEALLELQKAYVINPGSIIAGQEMLTTNEMILRERQRVQKTGKESPPEIRALTPYQEAQRKDSERISRLLSVPELKPLDPNSFDLHISGQKTKKVFESIGKISGINVLFDPEYAEPASPITVELQKTTLEEALDYVAVITKSYWKALSPNTIFVINDNQNKRRDYEEMVTKVFYLQNVTLPAELQEIQQILRTGCDIQRVFQYSAEFALVVRGEADRVELCQKLLRDIDKPKNEVLVDILVMDATSTFSKNFTAAIASTGLNIPLNFSPRSSLQTPTSTSTSSSSSSSSSSTTTTVPLSNLTHLSSADFSTTVPGALLSAALSDSRSKVLQAPQIRAVDNVKSTMNIGERVPIATGSYQTGVATTSVTGLVNTQFNYQDVGVNLELTTRVVENNEVYIHIKMEVSEIDNANNTVDGVTEPIIGQRKIDEELRVKEGDVALIGGVIKTQDDYSITGIPGLMNIPLLGKLFSGKSLDHTRDDLMIVMIPHIIRRPEYTEDNMRTIAVGTANAISLHHAPPKPADIRVDGEIPGTVSYAPPVPAATAPATQLTVPAANPGTVMAPPATAPPATAPPLMAPPATAPPATAPPATAPAATGASASGDGDKPAATARVLFNPSQMETRVSSPVSVAVVIEGGNDVASAPMVIRYDPKMVRLNDATAGEFLAADGQTAVVTKNIQNDQGTATVVINRPPGLPGVSGPSGVLAYLNFQAISRGSTTLTISNISVRNSQGQPIAGGNPEMTLRIQ
jgi:general secretion pathway protein D